MAALPTEPVHITAGNATFYRHENKAVFAGNVILTQAEGELRADSLTIFTNAAHELQRAIASGKPAKYQGKPTPHQPSTVAQAQNIEFNNQKHQVILSGEALIVQGTNRLSSARIIYDTQTKVMEGQPDGKRKTQILFTPDKGTKWQH